MLQSFQLRVARSVTGIGVREVALYLGVSRTVISRWERQDPLREIKTKKVSADSLIFFFKQHGIQFCDNNIIKLDNKNSFSNSEHLTRFQLRAARAALGLTQAKLSSLTTLSVSSINYLETQNNSTLLNNTNKPIDDLVLKAFFLKAGIVFPDNFSIQVTPNIKIFN